MEETSRPDDSYRCWKWNIEDEPVSMAVEPEWRLDRQGDSVNQSYP